MVFLFSNLRVSTNFGGMPQNSKQFVTRLAPVHYCLMHTYYYLFSKHLQLPGLIKTSGQAAETIRRRTNIYLSTANLWCGVRMRAFKADVEEGGDDVGAVVDGEAGVLPLGFKLFYHQRGVQIRPISVVRVGQAVETLGIRVGGSARSREVCGRIIENMRVLRSQIPWRRGAGEIVLDFYGRILFYAHDAPGKLALVAENLQGSEDVLENLTVAVKKAQLLDNQRRDDHSGRNSGGTGGKIDGGLVFCDGDLQNLPFGGVNPGL